MRRESHCRSSRASAPLRTDIVTKTLEGYANKGIFRAFSCTSRTGKTVQFAMQWHKERVYTLVYDVVAGSLRFGVVLPKVPRSMYSSFKEFVLSKQSEEMLEHRRIDPARVRVSCSLKNGNVGLLFKSRDGDLGYATQKLVNLVHEVFVTFLRDGLYYEYMIETFEVDRDQLAG
jgi:hypothetical protein